MKGLPLKSILASTLFVLATSAPAHAAIDVDAAKARAMRQRMRMVARQASLDPNDGIEL